MDKYNQLEKIEKKLDKHNKHKQGKMRHKTKGKRDKKKHNRTIKGHYKDLVNSTSTPPNIHKISQGLQNKRVTSSYSPSINQELVTLASLPLENIESCNLDEAYDLKDPLEIYVPNKHNKQFVGECLQYDSPRAEEVLLKNLKANKHVDPAKIVPPIQSHGNCWFNTFFVTFFISDKGRKFFHFLRQLMIKGTQKDKTPIPSNLRNAFALLNFGIDSCLQGNDFAYILDTNSIIVELFNQIPESYKQYNPEIVDIDAAGNPVDYYMSIINYLNNNSIQLLFLRYVDATWKDTLANEIREMTHLPHIIVIEIFEENAKKMNRKPVSFKVNKAKYQIDSAVIRDTEQEHFCATITCEGKEMGYDGMSTHRLIPFEWKKYLNTDYTWEFGGSTHANGKPMKWNFMKSYQLLIYYRVE
jgi:hypothetical protein